MLSTRFSCLKIDHLIQQIGITSEQPPSSSLFLHDLVVSQALSGQGIVALMIKRLVELATQMGYCRIRLVTVQNSVGFCPKAY
nr:GNAT family N-acetyltransferase [Pseudoalteromonas piscicida]